MASEAANVTAALVALAEAGIPTDVQELLVRGDASRGIAPGAILKALNTRPTPAATDTGLVTFSVEMLRDYAFMKADPEGDYVARSQAEEILAAERADKEELREALHAVVEARKADNAAQAARIKELAEYAREATKAITGLTGGGSENFGKEIGDVFTADLPRCLERIRERYVSKVELKRLEAKLAAATETAARAAYRACAETRHVSLGHAAADAVRAALEGKP